jgi:hypothetical protein
VLVAIAIYFSHGSINVAQKNHDVQTQSERVSLVVNEISLTPISESEVRLHAQFKNISNRSVESYALLPFAFDIKTKEVKQLANVSGTNPKRREASFEIDAILKKSDLLSVLTLCLFHVDSDGHTYVDITHYSVPSPLTPNSLDPIRNLPQAEYPQNPAGELLTDRERIKLNRANDAAESNGGKATRPWDRDADGKRPWEKKLPSSDSK